MQKISSALKDNFISGKYIISVSDFLRDKEKLTKLIKKINVNHMYSPENQKGIYLFAKKGKNDFSFKYVGISKQVISRLKQHICSLDKGSATWAFLMAKYDYNKKNNLIEEITKNNFKSKDEIKNEIKKQQDKIAKDYFVTYYPVENNFLLHMVEPYVACDLECYWNSFETH
jgi:hypothetical protein